jgi:hypothetical protein
MANKTVEHLGQKTDAAWATLNRQLAGLEPHLEKADAPGEWTTRQVLSHLLLPPGFEAAAVLGMFRDHDYPVLPVQPGQVVMTPERQKMTLREFVETLEAQRRAVYGYLDTVPEADLQTRKVRIPPFKSFLGTEEVSLATFVGVMFDGHWKAHAEQLGKIRTAAGLPEAR